eukprot:4508636-Pyramimonas_sp.AAC.1
MRGGDACRHRHWGHRWSFLCGHETYEGSRNWWRGRMWALPVGPSVEFPMGPQKVRGVCRNGWRRHMWAPPLGLS